MRWAMLRKSIVGRLGEEAQQAESNSIKLAKVVTAMRKAHLKARGEKMKERVRERERVNNAAADIQRLWKEGQERMTRRLV